jgi:outer membrane protein TolC
MKLLLKISVIFTIAFLTINLNAETINLDLNTARELALNNNPSLKLAQEGVAKSRAKVGEARSAFMPSLSAFGQYQHAWELQKTVMPNFIKAMMVGMVPQTTLDLMPDYMAVSFGMENTVAAGISLSQPIYTGGMIWNAYQMSKIGANISTSQLKVTEQKILCDVASAYYGVLFANSAAEVAEEGLHSAQQNLEQVQKFFEVGKASRFDVLRAEVQVANFTPMVISANNAKRLAESNLRVMLGVNDDVNFNYVEKLQYVETDLIDLTLDDLLTTAIKERPEVKMLSDQKKIAQKQVTLNQAAYLPTVAFGTSYQYTGQRNDIKFVSDDFYKSFNSSISLSIPIFNGFSTRTKVQQAKIAVKEIDYQAENALNGIKLEVKSAYYKLKEANENVQTQSKTIEQAKEALRLSELMYSEGSSTQLDVLNANVALNQAQMNYQKSLYEYNVALATLKKAVNQL